jgi:rod shape-determining protein MreC
VNRNGVRSIAGGTGALDVLQLENVSVTADIREGDLLETSGLGGRFPAGFPVGYVNAVVIEPTAAFATVSVRPLARLDRSRHVLVVLAPENLDMQGLEAEGLPEDPSEPFEDDQWPETLRQPDAGSEPEPVEPSP